MSLTDQTAQPGGGYRWGVILPVLIFTGMVILFVFALYNSDGLRKLPSALLGKPVPAYVLGIMPGLTGSDGKQVPTFTNKDLELGKYSIVNVWASWCASCRYEHPFLTRLAQKTGAKLYGLNYKDTAKNGRRFLARYGNPYTAVGMDKNGRAGIEWGVYGVPETFVVDGRGVIIYKYPGPINDLIIDKQILPAIEKSRNGGE